MKGAIMSTNLAFLFGGGVGWPEMAVILGLALLVFGKRLPEVGRSLGRGLVEFKKGLKGVKDELEDVDREVEEATERAEAEADAEAAQLEDKSEDDAVSGPAIGEKTKAKEKAEA